MKTGKGKDTDRQPITENRRGVLNNGKAEDHEQNSEETAGLV